ncbi:hypothetical protein [Pseudoflavitalea rhizosphaerae]|uniref:hypothetical protein n=1 Tax=Pseudoflavitalea rhizosphaerae TaxID=1884793 RepID=UPI000F8C9B9D|nr:hypothetical protein [Pseudoflavitalea rhizosphaerae]
MRNNTAHLSLQKEPSETVITSIHQLFNGDSIEKIRSDMDNLQNTTITESYGDLNKEDKWLLIDFLRRISNLIEVAHVLITKPDNPEIAPN